MASVPNKSSMKVASNQSLNEKFSATPMAPDGHKPARKSLTEFCYSVANLIIIIASIVALIVLIQFMQDDPLYEYGEHILSLHFYRQLIYIIVIVPLILMIPVFNAASVFFQTTNNEHKTNKPVTNIRLFYQILVLVLVCIGLIFVVPYIRTNSVSSHIELELKKHMKFRYENTFSYEFLDRLQEQYECCDELWYRANMHDNLPASCFVPDGTFSLIYGETCPYTIGSLVSTRCCIVAVSLVAIIIALVCLILIDARKVLTPSESRQYDVTRSLANDDVDPSINVHQQRQWQQKQQHSLAPDVNTNGNPSTMRDDQHDWRQTIGHQMGPDDALNGTSRNRSSTPTRNIQSFAKTAATNNRLKSDERNREAPLIRSAQQEQPVYSDDYGDEQLHQDDDRDLATSSPTILTRANYNLIRRERSQSPVFLGRAVEKQQAGACSSGESIARASPIKSALKKSTSQQKLTISRDESGQQQRQQQHASPSDTIESVSLESGVEDAESLDEYVAKLRSNSLIRQQRERDQQTKRSLMSVRFADDWNK